MGNSESGGSPGILKKLKEGAQWVGNTVTNAVDPLGLFHEKNDDSLQGALKNFGQSAISGVANTLNSGIDLLYDPFGDHGVVGDNEIPAETGAVGQATQAIAEQPIKGGFGNPLVQNSTTNSETQLVPTPLYYYPRGMRGRAIKGGFGNPLSEKSGLDWGKDRNEHRRGHNQHSNTFRPNSGHHQGPPHRRGRGGRRGRGRRGNNDEDDEVYLY